MKPTFLLLAATAAASLSTTAHAGETTSAKQARPLTPLDDRWRFSLASPGWMANVTGDAGLDGVISEIDVGFGDILPRIDMAWATRAEASKGRFGILGELIYLSMSDGVGSATVVKKVDVRVDQYLADFALRWRLVEGERGFVDVLAGVRYTNLYQAVSLQANDQRIGEVAEDFTDEIGARLRERIEETLSTGRFRNALKAAVSERITDRLGSATGPEARESNLPHAALAHRQTGRIGGEIERLVQRREQQLVATATAELREAAAAEASALQQAVAAERDRLLARAAELRGRVNQRITDAKEKLEEDIEKVLKKNLNRRFVRADDWWDPYVGLRARYNFTPAIYVIGRGDIGGFGVGSDLMWQAEAALGFQVTRSIFTELGYRALSFDYEKDGLTYDVITHGAQVTVGLNF